MLHYAEDIGINTLCRLKTSSRCFQQVALFWDVAETLGSGVQLKEVVDQEKVRKGTLSLTTSFCVCFLAHHEVNRPLLCLLQHGRLNPLKA